MAAGETASAVSGESPPIAEGVGVALLQGAAEGRQGGLESVEGLQDGQAIL